ncbi:hypothetical protein B0T18DRAFT_145980 [Schizothecium vesticola]|uniref:Uncharacterized protein n=1 Tax=Schizothecium vesticola TaxID=314040 RepID=A0AA40EVI4_9PEZI|nr:hypothetical protein B0T18DRAFT_145980 [Schizothecium vesticola]
MEGMSMMFSPYGDGPLPPTAMAELERKLKANKQTRNFLKMLDLEKKPKVDQVQSAPVSVPASPPPPPPPPPAKPLDTGSLQARRAESAFQQQNSQMPSASRRSVLVPPLSLAIPPSPGGQRGVRTQQPGDVNAKGSERADERETETSANSLHKHVKFLAPDEGEMSDQSSICQSPSWEGYGQRKKDKKEAERKKKEKELAEKEARANKRRNGARLSKSPPPPLPDRKLIVPGLTYADRSMSDPMLISSHLHPSRQTEQLQGDFGRTCSADNLQQLQQHQPDMAEVLSDYNSNGQPFVGGVKLERERETTMHSQYSFPYSQYSGHTDADRSPQAQHSPPLDGSMPAGYPSMKQDGRQGFPPSASRTPMLRQMPPPPARERSNSLLQGATKMFKGRDGKSQGDGDSDRGRHRDGYVQNSREQSTERSMAEIVYDQLINNGSIQSSSTRSSSRHTQNTRRSSFSQEAKSVAMKLAGMVTGPSSKDDSSRGNRASVHRDYFGYPDSKPEAPGALGTATFPSRPQDNWRGLSVDEPLSPYAGEFRDVYAAQDRPATSQSSGSSSNPSVAGSVSGSHHRQARRAREAAPPPPNIPTGRQPSSNTSGSVMNGHGDFAGPILGKAVTSLRSDYMAKAGASIPRPDSATVPLDGCDTTPRATMKPPAKPTKPTAVDTAVGRASEGSSSSSAYEDGSPVSSPVTTPDTSRPQSSRGVPFTVGEIVKGMSESPGGYDDESTLRQLSDQSSEASTSSTPRLLKSGEHHGADEEEEEGWSGTAAPVDTDDAQSFTTSFSNLDNIENIDGNLVSASTSSRPPAETQETRFRNLAETLQRPAELSLRHGSSAKSSVDPPITIPPRSKRRGTGSSHSPSSPDLPLREERQALGPGSEEPSNDIINPDLFTVADHAELEQLYDEEKGALKREKAKRRQRQVLSRSPDEASIHEHDRDLAYGDTFSSLGVNSSTFIVPDIPRSPYHSNFPGSSRAPSSTSRASSRAGVSPPSPGLSRFPRATSPPQHPPPPSPGLSGAHRSGPGPNAPWRPPSSASTRSSASGGRTANAMPPVSILKHPARATLDTPQPASSASSRASMLSALPKHMQVQSGVSTRPPGMTPESRMTPIAKMFVECCGCKFYHDMPSKLYECMAKPDAVVEDRMLGISGAITTMVKCPWCQHNMSTSCCAGYAAVVYLKEKVH